MQKVILSLKFYNDQLNIDGDELKTIRWTNVVLKLVKLPYLSTNNIKLDPLDITNRIMRKENYIISRSSQMKHFMPTKNKGIRKLIEKKYETISIHEYNTSKKCSNCLENINYMKHNNKKTFRHLCCHKCLSSENK